MVVSNRGSAERLNRCEAAVSLKLCDLSLFKTDDQRVQSVNMKSQGDVRHKGSECSIFVFEQRPLSLCFTDAQRNEHPYMCSCNYSAKEISYCFYAYKWFKMLLTAVLKRGSTQHPRLDVIIMNTHLLLEAMWG